MGLIIKLTDEKTKKDYYMEWSTICDAPLTYGCSLKEFKKYYKEEYGRSGMRELPNRLKRVEQTGCSDRMIDDMLEYLMENNRAGKNETRMTKEQILNQFCRKRTGNK